jgi:hypothetical protein
MSTISHRFTSTNRSSTFWHIFHNLLASFVHARPKPSKLAGLVAGIDIKVLFPCLSSVCIRVTADHGISAWSVTDPALSTRASLTACDSLALCIKLPPTVLASRNTTTNTSSALRPQQRLAPRIPSFASQFTRLSFTIMSHVAVSLWGCPGLSVGVHRFDNNAIGAPFWQVAGHPVPIPNPKFNDSQFLISEKDVRFAIVVNINPDFFPINNILIGSILSIDLTLDGFQVADYLWETESLKWNQTAFVAILASPPKPRTGEVMAFKFSEPAFGAFH